MEHYSREFKKPIIYGGISGVPEGYSFALHFEYRDPKGQVKRVSREFEDKDDDAKDRVFRYAFFLPPGRWALRQVELMGLKESGESTLVTKSPKEVMVIFKMRDSIGAGFEFDTGKDSLYYLGRWTFGGFESLESLLPEAIARFNGSKKKAADSSRHSIQLSLAVADSTESDLAYFRKKNPTLRSKKSLPAIPAHPVGRESLAFDLLIANPESPPHHWAHDFHMRQMMAPQIPKPKF
jgi:hypothetical protein